MSESPTIEEKVIQKICERRQLGLAKYGTSMERTDLSRLEWLKHAQAEAMDHSIYLEKLISLEEGQDVPEAPADVQAASRHQELETLRVRVAQYRELVRRLAASKDKADAWYRAKAWCPFWKALAFDLPSENEQQAMLFQ